MSAAAKPVRTAASLVLCARSPISPISPASPRTQDFRVLLLKRNARGTFGGLTVFPGGAADPHDADPDWAARFPRSPIPPPLARAGPHLGITALRETFEECGILLLASDQASASPSASTSASASASALGSRLSLKENRDWRQRVYNDPAQYLALHKHLAAAPPLSRLVYWANWITPVVERSRFNTHFFLTVVDGEVAGLGADAAGAGSDASAGIVEADGSETLSLAWMTPSEALDAFKRQEISMFPPQFFILSELAAMTFDQLEHMVNSSATLDRHVVPFQPELVGMSPNKNPVMALPGDEKHSSAAGQSDTKGRRNRIEMVRREGRVVDLIVDKSEPAKSKL
ncbi:hypothetical protein BC831DRAFT_442071 [Entophlyctis helioformis]|nr:hypothetical protein BC831DRAFT_442071 [Entophlyctis helioformis]